MDRKRLFYLTIIIFMFVLTTFAVCYFPDTIPVHFNIFYSVDEKGSSSILFSMPVIALIIGGVTPFLSKNKNFLFLLKKRDSLPIRYNLSNLIFVAAAINIVWIIMCFVWLK